MARTMVMVNFVTANSLYTFPTAEGGQECLLSPGVLTQALLQHVDQCMQHEDVVKKSMLAQIARTIKELHFDSFSDLIEEMCLERLRGIGPLESHGCQRLLLYGETLLLRSHDT